MILISRNNRSSIPVIRAKYLVAVSQTKRLNELPKSALLLEENKRIRTPQKIAMTREINKFLYFTLDIRQTILKKNYTNVIL
jgi:hypothetical protein